MTVTTSVPEVLPAQTLRELRAPGPSSDAAAEIVRPAHLPRSPCSGRGTHAVDHEAEELRPPGLHDSPARIERPDEPCARSRGRHSLREEARDHRAQALAASKRCVTRSFRREERLEFERILRARGAGGLGRLHHSTMNWQRVAAAGRPDRPDQITIQRRERMTETMEQG